MPSIRPPPWICLLLGTLFITTSNTPAFAAARRLDPNTEIAPQPQRRRSCWIFNHMQKSGGTTIKRIIGRLKDCHLILYDTWQWKMGGSKRDSVGRELGSSLLNTTVVGGYTEALRLTTEAQENCAWFTVFRHPVERLVSAFFYCQKSEADPVCATTTMPPEAGNDIVAFAKHWGNFGLRQFALGVVPAEDVIHYITTTAREHGIESNPARGLRLDQISGWYLLKMYLERNAGAGEGAPEPDDPMSDMLQPVKNLLHESYAAVGILEEFNTTLSLFNAALDMPGLDWHKEFANIGVINTDYEHKQEEKDALAVASTSAELQGFIQLDLLLYECALAVFHEQVQLHGVV